MVSKIEAWKDVDGKPHDTFEEAARADAVHHVNWWADDSGICRGGEYSADMIVASMLEGVAGDRPRTRSGLDIAFAVLYHTQPSELQGHDPLRQERLSKMLSQMERIRGHKAAEAHGRKLGGRA